MPEPIDDVVADLPADLRRRICRTNLEELMAQFLGLGMTHYPLLAGTDEHMASLLRWTLADPDIPAEAKDPVNWSAAMRAEWGDRQRCRRSSPSSKTIGGEPRPVP